MNNLICMTLRSCFLKIQVNAIDHTQLITFKQGHLISLHLDVDFMEPSYFNNHPVRWKGTKVDVWSVTFKMTVHNMFITGGQMATGQAIQVNNVFAASWGLVGTLATTRSWVSLTPDAQKMDHSATIVQRPCCQVSGEGSHNFLLCLCNDFLVPQLTTHTKMILNTLSV